MRETSGDVASLCLDPNMNHFVPFIRAHEAIVTLLLLSNPPSSPLCPILHPHMHACRIEGGTYAKSADTSRTSSNQPTRRF